jgi:hypothetical protein
MLVRHEYKLSLAEATLGADACAPAGVLVRGVSPTDTHELAELMLDAYRNTIDYEGEGLAEAVAEIERYFTRASMKPAIAQCSSALDFRDSMSCACLLECWARRNVPFVGFVICRAAHKHKGLGKFALQQSVEKLVRAGYSELRTLITKGNTASEALFTHAGFRRVD